MSKVQNESSHPRATVHKQILERAAERRDASLEEIAAETTGATVDLVERVLSEYGDPGVDTDATDEDGRSKPATGESGPVEPGGINGDGQDGADIDQLSKRQIRTLRAIQDHPDATQREIADVLEVCPATVCNRVNDIEGFDWESRREFVRSILGENETMTHRSEIPSASLQRVEDRIDELTEQVAVLERRLDEGADASPSLSTDPDYAHKVIHACIQSDRISEEEELRVIEDLLRTVA